MIRKFKIQVKRYHELNTLTEYEKCKNNLQQQWIGPRQTWHQNEPPSPSFPPPPPQMRLFGSNIKKLQWERVGAREVPRSVLGRIQARMTVGPNDSRPKYLARKTSGTQGYPGLPRVAWWEAPSQGNSNRLGSGYPAVSKEMTEVFSCKREAVFHVVNVWKMPLRMLLRLVLESNLKTWKNFE